MKEIKAVSFQDLIDENPSFEQALDEIADFSELDDESTFPVSRISEVIESAKEWDDSEDMIASLEKLEAFLKSKNFKLIIWD